VITPDSYIIREAFSPNPVAVGTIRRCVWELVTRCNISKNEIQPGHACRKYFNTICINAGVNHLFKELLMGHSVNLENTYYDLTNEGSLLGYSLGSLPGIIYHITMHGKIFYSSWS
jgi:hypothetical protein